MDTTHETPEFEQVQELPRELVERIKSGSAIESSLEEVSKKREADVISKVSADAQQTVPEPKKLKIQDELQFVLEKEWKSDTVLSVVKYSHNGKYLACASSDKTITIYEADTFKPCHVLKGHALGISDVAWSYDSKYLASGSDDKTVCIWDVQSGELLKILKGHTNYVFCVKFNRTSSLLCSGSYDESVRVWDVKTGNLIRTLPAHSDPVTSVDFSRDGVMMASGSYDGLVRLWDTSTGNCLKTLSEDTNYPISYVEFSANSKYLLTANLNSSLRLWQTTDIGTPKVVKCYGGHKNEKHCHFAEYYQTKYIVMGSEDNCVYVWSMPSGQVIQKLEGHHSPVLCVSTNPVNKKLCTCSTDGNVKIWSPK